MSAGAAKMQAAAAAAAAVRSGLEPATAPIERLPDVLALLFRHLDSKTLMMAVAAVSAWGNAGSRGGGGGGEGGGGRCVCVCV